MPAGSSLDELDENQLVRALSHALMASGRYIERLDQDSWRSLVSDWGFSPSDGRAMLLGHGGNLLACVCQNDVRPHVHAFLADGRSAEATKLEPLLVPFCSYQTSRVRDLLEHRSLLRHLRQIAIVLKSLAGLVVGASIKLFDSVAPGYLPLPADPSALIVTFSGAAIILARPLTRFAVLSWRLRGGSWELPSVARW